MKVNQTLKLVQSAIVCALVFTATWIVVPTPMFGNVNLGDSMVLLGALTLGGPYAVVSCALGAALCDLAAGYTMYAPATLIIKASMVIVMLLFRKLSKKPLVTVPAAICAELLMTAAYFAYEAWILGYGLTATMNIPFNLIQGAMNILLAFAIGSVLKKAGIITPKSD